MCRHSRLARSVPDASRGRAATRSQSLPNRDSPPPESPRTHPCRHPTPNGIVQTALRRPAGEWTLRAREAYGLQATPSSWSLHQAESRLLGLSASSRPSPLPSNTELPPDGELPLELELPVEGKPPLALALPEPDPELDPTPPPLSRRLPTSKTASHPPIPGRPIAPRAIIQAARSTHVRAITRLPPRPRRRRSPPPPAPPLPPHRPRGRRSATEAPRPRRSPQARRPQSTQCPTRAPRS